LFHTEVNCSNAYIVTHKLKSVITTKTFVKVRYCYITYYTSSSHNQLP